MISNNFKFKVTENGIIITDYTDYTGKGIDLVIPDTINGLPVINIDKHAFAYCTSLKSVTISKSVTAIGDYAFFKCNNLKSVIIPEGATTIGNCAFACCNELAPVKVLNSVTVIGRDAFYECSTLCMTNSEKYYKELTLSVKKKTEKQITKKQINQSNFFISTIAEFNLIEDVDVFKSIVKDKDCNYISESGSMYWYTDEGVYRLSDHWQRVASCYWNINCEPPTDGEEILGFCKWSEFKTLTTSFVKLEDLELNKKYMFYMFGYFFNSKVVLENSTYMIEDVPGHIMETGTIVL